MLFFIEAAAVVILLWRGELMMADSALVCLGRFDLVAFADDATPFCAVLFLSEVLGLTLFTLNFALLESFDPLLGACWLFASEFDF